ncbi:flagellar basal body P-ring formation protein FlgA [Duganella sp. FT80W]|uniref:Flagellar basal body P-ring formation protein FlgA n=1 Tax=Duganella guangzhouensis TaxID=2666084 RepID=A0A6I2L7F1_9BURK|nr:flagellar basal body P-ring formation chaperone FlgA [Duganella guangzhouensis]MRW94165.1 flagellar basal body P-ring formation protein FlgA [Duganella guangzhouensis]
MRIWGLLMLLVSSQVCADQIVLDLRAEVLLHQPRATLADVAVVTAADPDLQQAFASVVVSSAPLAGYVEQRSRAELELALRGQALALGHSIVWRGATAVRLRTEVQQLDNAVLLEVARDALLQALGNEGRVEVVLATPLPAMAAPTGALSYQARLLDASRLRARMAVRVEVMVQGTLYRSVIVPLAVRAYRRVYVAQRMLAAGNQVVAGDVIEREQDIAPLGQSPVPVGALHDGARLRQSVEAGQVLGAQHLVADGALLRGDRVHLRMMAAGIAVETMAVAQADAAAGQLVRVKPERSNETVLARVITPALVRIEE